MTPNLKSLALAAVEARRAFDNASRNDQEGEYEAWMEATQKFHLAATPERILQFRNEVLEEAANAASEACWKHVGEDAYSQGMDAGAIHQTKACAAAIRSLKTPEPT